MSRRDSRSPGHLRNAHEIPLSADNASQMQHIRSSTCAIYQESRRRDRDRNDRGSLVAARTARMSRGPARDEDFVNS